MRPIVTDRVAWSVGLSVCDTSEPCKNGCADRDVVWVVGSSGPKESCVRWGSRRAEGHCHGNHFWLYMKCTLAPPGEYECTVHVRRRCSLMSNYFDHLLNILGITYSMYDAILLG